MNDLPARALVTGGSGAIGTAICRRLAAAGHFVYVHAHRNAGIAENLAAELNSVRPCAEPLCFDVTDEAAARTSLTTLLAAGPIQILVNNAGIHSDAVFPAME